MSAMMNLAKRRAAMVVGDFDFTNNGAPLTALTTILNNLNATYTRNSVKNVVQNGALVSLSANQFGTSYDPVAATYGYVPEPAATNLCLRSTLEGGGSVPTGWTQPAATGSSTAVTSSWGSAQNAVAYSHVATAQRPFFAQTIALSANTTYTASMRIESVTAAIGVAACLYYDTSTLPAGATVSFPVCEANPSGGSAGVVTTGKLTMTVTTVGTSGNLSVRVGLGASGAATGTLQFSRPQFETGLRATSWIATTGSTASRSADVLTVPLWINNIKDSQDGSTANWTRTNCTVTTSGTAPDGTATAQLITASSTATVTCYNNSCKAPAAVVTASIYVKQGNKATASVVLRNNTTATSFQAGTLTFATGVITGTGWSVTNEGNGWFRCVFTQATGISVGDTLYVYPMPSPTLTSGDTQYFWGAQIEPGSVATAYRPTVNNLEYARNRLSFSENFGNSAWSKTNTTVTEDAAASPNGNVTADKLIVNAAASLGNSYTGRTYTKSAEAQTHTVSVRAKIGEYNKLILYVAGASTSDSCQMTANLSTGAVVASSQTGTFTKLGQTCTSAGNGYYLLTLSFTTNTDPSLQVRLYPTDTVATTGDGTSGVYIFGAQLNNGSAATEYEPTDTLTPSANANITGFSSAGYTLVVDQRMDTTLAASVEPIELSSFSTVDRALIYAGGGTAVQCVLTANSSTQAAIVGGSLGLTRKKYAGSFATNNVMVSTAGVAATPDTSATMATGFLFLHIGAAYTGSIQYNGFIFGGRLITQALTQAQINGLTT